MNSLQKIGHTISRTSGVMYLLEKLDKLRVYTVDYLNIMRFVAHLCITGAVTCIQWLMCICAAVSVGVNCSVLKITGGVLEATTWWGGNTRKRIIPDRESSGDYLERYYLLLADRDTFPFNVFVHKFLKSDPDDVHNHPWGFAHLIVRSGYWETVAQPSNPLKTERYWRGAGYFNIVSSNHTHRIDLDPEKPLPITLFIPFGKQMCSIWGFYVRRADLKSKGKAVSRFIHHEEYFELKRRNQDCIDKSD
jgi:hypothetical protein